MHRELVTQNVMHASLCHMTSVGTGGTGGVTPRQGGQVRGEGGQVGKWRTGGWIGGTDEGDRRGRKVENRRGGDVQVGSGQIYTSCPIPSHR